MDALAGYGSDSSANSSEGNSNAREAGGAVGVGALSALLPASSSENEASEKEPGGKGGNGVGGAADAHTADVETKDGGDIAAAPRKKRRRRWDNPEARECESPEVRRPSLPPPRLLLTSADGGDGDEDDSGPGAFDSLILFDKDYTAQCRNRSFIGGQAPAHNPELVEKLNRLHQSFYSDKGVAKNTDAESGRPASFASNLRSQHDFGNPHLFPSVVSHCGIEPRGTNLPPSLWDPAEFNDFEMSDRLLSAEEQARIAAAERARTGE